MATEWRHGLPQNPQVISNSNLRGSKVLGHVNHDSWNARIVWFGTTSPLTPQCDLRGHQVARNVLHAVTATKVDTCQRTCNLAVLVAEWRTSETQYFVDNRTYITGKSLPHVKYSSKRSDSLRFYLYLCHVLLRFILALNCNTKISEKSDMTKSWALGFAACHKQELFVAQELINNVKQKCCWI